MDIHIEDLLQATIDEGASDLHIRAHMPPKLRVHGELLPIADEELSEEESLALCQEMVDRLGDPSKMTGVAPTWKRLLAFALVLVAAALALV